MKQQANHRLKLFFSFLVAILATTEAAAQAKGAGKKTDTPTAFTQNGIAIYEVGTGAPLVVITGGPGASSQLYRKYLAPLADKRRLIFWDYRATGQSKDLKKFSFADDHQDLLDVVHALKLERFSILAHSYGGVHAIKYASEHPDRVLELVLVSTSPNFKKSSAVTREKKKANMSASDSKRMQELWTELKDPKRSRDAEHEISMIEARNQLRNPTDAQRREFAEESGLNYEAVMKTDGWVELDQESVLGKIKAKTLVVFSENDIIVPSMFSARIAELVPGSKTARFSKSSHWIFWEEQKGFVDSVKKFLN